MSPLCLPPRLFISPAFSVHYKSFPFFSLSPHCFLSFKRSLQIFHCSLLARPISAHTLIPISTNTASSASFVSYKDLVIINGILNIPFQPVDISKKSSQSPSTPHQPSLLPKPSTSKAKPPLSEWPTSELSVLPSPSSGACRPSL
jgi:hypothetical protein